VNICPTCKQTVREIVVEDRKLDTHAPADRNVPSGTGRYVTVLDVTCGCGERIERRYEKPAANDCRPLTSLVGT
jgi:hypothetical protein